MADISKLKVNETTYDIKDSTARSGLENKVEEAPFDGAEYVRKNGSWALSSGAGGAGATSAIYFYNQTVNVANNAEILRITDSSITPYIVVLECTFANPSYITSDVTWTSYDGYISFTGTCTAATTANVTLGILADGKVNKSGDTMTGNLVLSKTLPSINLADDQISITTTSTGYIGNLAFRDKNYRTVGVVESQKINSYTTQLNIYNRMIDSNGNNIDNYLRLRSDTNGTQTVVVSSTTAWLNGIQAVSRAGDTMTGPLIIQRSGNAIAGHQVKWTAYSLTTLPTDNNQYIDSFQCVDKYNNRNFHIRNHIYSDGSIQIDLKAIRDGVFNGVDLKIANNGTRTVAFDDPSIWRNALGLGDSDWQTLPHPSPDKYSGNIRYRKIGSLLQISVDAISLLSALNANSSVNLGQLPTNYRPSRIAVGCGYVNIGTNRTVSIMLWTDGNIELFNNGTQILTSNTIYFSGTALV